MGGGPAQSACLRQKLLCLSLGAKCTPTAAHVHNQAHAIQFQQQPLNIKDVKNNRNRRTKVRQVQVHSLNVVMLLIRMVLLLLMLTS